MAARGVFNISADGVDAWRFTGDTSSRYFVRDYASWMTLTHNNDGTTYSHYWNWFMTVPKIEKGGRAEYLWGYDDYAGIGNTCWRLVIQKGSDILPASQEVKYNSTSCTIPFSFSCTEPTLSVSSNSEWCAVAIDGSNIVATYSSIAAALESRSATISLLVDDQVVATTTLTQLSCRLRLGSTLVSALRIGSASPSAAYIGTTKVYP